jgi:hypothetical protein
MEDKNTDKKYHTQNDGHCAANSFQSIRGRLLVEYKNSQDFAFRTLLSSLRFYFAHCFIDSTFYSSMKDTY